MKSHFDMENLPSVFGGKATLKYDHQQFSQMMTQDELKAVQFWGFDDKAHHIVNGPSSGPEVAPEPITPTNWLTGMSRASSLQPFWSSK